MAQPEEMVSEDSLKGVSFFNHAIKLFSSKPDSSAILFETAIPYLYKSSQYERYIDCFNALHKIAWINEDYNLAKKNALIAWSSSQKLLTNSNSTYVRSMQNLGVLYENEGLTSKAIQLIRKSLLLQLSKPEPDSMMIIQIYKNLGIIHSHQRRFEKALEYYNQALSILKQYSRSQKVDFANTYHHLGKVYMLSNRRVKAKSFFEMAIKIYESVNSKTGSRLLLSSYNQMIKLCENSKRASYEYKALELIDTYDLKGNSTYITLANFAIENSNYSRANSLLDYAIRINAFSETINPLRNAEIYLVFAYLEIAQKNFSQSLNYLRTAMEVFAPGASFDMVDYDQLQYKVRGIEVMGMKGEVLLTRYHELGELEDLHQAWATFEVARNLISAHRKSVDYESAKVFLAQKVKRIYEHTLETLHLLYGQTQNPLYLKAAFSVIEENKASVMYEAMSDSRALFGLPDSLREREQSLKVYISKLEKKVFDLHSLGDSTKEFKTKSELFELKNEYYELIEELENEYPNYYREKYQVLEVDPMDIQRQLSPRQGLISYLYGEKYIYAFCISESNMDFLQIRKVDDCESWIRNYYELISDYQGPKSDSIWFDLSYRIYKHLLKEPLESLGYETSRFTILPDDILNFIPFESLLTSPASLGNAYSELPYLIREYSVSYLSTCKQFTGFSNIVAESHPDKTWLGMAPSYGVDQIQELVNKKVNKESFLAIRGTNEQNRMGQLDFAKEEVSEVSALLEGVDLVGGQATESAFLDHCHDYSILHLATHGLISDENSLYHKLLFAPDEDSLIDAALHAYEVYNLDLNADMVVLSACNTGFGQVAKGEGVMSLSRAFTFSGCKSVINTLWQVSDRSSSELMTKFYKSLIAGASKDEAMHEAKLTYLNQVSEPYLAHPYFWSSYIASGDMSPLDWPKDKSYLLWGILISIFLAFMIFKFFLS